MAKVEHEMVNLKDESNLHSPLIKQNLDSPTPHLQQPPQPEQPYYTSTTQPKIPFKHLPLALLPGILISCHILLADYVSIPSLQYFFLVTLFSFLLNYALLRKYQLYPFINESKYDNILKIMCVLTLASVLMTVQWGWNGSVGILVGIVWEAMRGNRVRGLWIGLLMVVVGCVLLEGTWDLEKFFQLVPGILLGFVNATLYTLNQTSPYTIYHQFSLLSTIFLPMFFPIQPMIKLTLLQWGIILIGSVVALITAHMTIHMMQKQRVSIAITAMCAILTLMTTKYETTVAMAEGALVGVGLGVVMYQEYGGGREAEEL